MKLAFVLLMMPSLLYCKDDFKAYLFFDITSCKTCNIGLITDYVNYFKTSKIPINIVITNVNSKNLKAAKKVAEDTFDKGILIYDTNSAMYKQYNMNQTNSFVLLKNDKAVFKIQNIKFDVFNLEYFYKFIKGEYRNITNLNFGDNYPLGIYNTTYNYNSQSLNILDKSQNYIYIFNNNGEIENIYDFTDELNSYNKDNIAIVDEEERNTYNKYSKSISLLSNKESLVLLYKLDSFKKIDNSITPVYKYEVYDYKQKKVISNVQSNKYSINTINCLWANNKLISPVFDRNYYHTNHDKLLNTASIISLFDGNNVKDLMYLGDAQNISNTVYSFNFPPTISYINDNSVAMLNQLNSLFVALDDINNKPKIINLEATGKLKTMLDLYKSIDKFGLFEGIDIDIPRIDTMYISSFVSDNDYTYVAIVNTNKDKTRNGISLQKYSNKTGKFIAEKDVELKYRLNDKWQNLNLVSAEQDNIKFLIEWEKEGYDLVEIKF